MYVYESHLGGVYATDDVRDCDDTYCDTCGDSDWLIGVIETPEELRELMKDYSQEYTEEVIKGIFN
ncbi:MAG: hypothetical protein PHE79_05040 [Eubacteriales bacterium]|nr:hypothetical protein [Eubacteriales bacterium]